VLAAVLARFWYDRAPQEGAPSAAAPENAPAATPPPAAAAQPPHPVPARKAVAIAPRGLEKGLKEKSLNPPPALAPPVAAASGDAEKPKDDSVFGWGPWSGSGSAGSAGGPAAQDGVPRVEGLSRTLSAAPPGGFGAAGSPGAPSAPPPVDSSIRPGYGYGDTNHVHIPRRDR